MIDRVHPLACLVKHFKFKKKIISKIENYQKKNRKFHRQICPQEISGGQKSVHTRG
jgi:hypothetical protein